MDNLVSEFIRRTGGDPWRWGQTDCALWPASLVAEITGRDPAADLRGTYDTAFGCRQVLLRAGGLAGLSRRLMAGFRTGETETGVAVARLEGQVLCGVLRGGRLVIKTDGGVRMTRDFTLLTGWGLD